MSPFVTPQNIGPLLERDNTLSLYIHVPFCTSRCIYCDFYSTVSTSLTDDMLAYTDALLAQIRTLAQHFSGTISSIYFGGGTPSLLGETISEILHVVKSSIDVSENAEITVESNPDSLNAAALDSWRKAGVTRISLGVQSFDNETLKTLGRIHSAEDAVSALTLLNDEGWIFSLDLIAGIPHVSMEQWRDSLGKAIASGASHLSIYPLSVEEDTPLETLICHGIIPDVDEDSSADHMLAARHELMRAGFEHYEIANFAKPGFQSVHNSRYWTGGSYLGLGPGAASMLYTVSEAGRDCTAHAERVLLDSHAASPIHDRVRFVLHETLEEFLENPEMLVPSEWEDLAAVDAAREDIMLGLRLFRGVPTSVIEGAGLQDALNIECEQGLVEVSEGSYRLTERGWLLGNEVFSKVWCDD